MSTEGSLSRHVLPAGLACLAVSVGYLAHQSSAMAAAGLGLHARMLVAEVCLAAPAVLALLSFEIPVRDGLALRPVSLRAFLATVVAGASLWTCAVGLGVVQAVLWTAPAGHEEMFDAMWQALTPHGPGGVLLSLAAVALVPAVCEEALFRGALLPALLTRLRAPAAVIVSASLFAAIHTMPTKDDGVTLYQVPQAFLVGAALAVLRLRSGSLLPGILAHTLYNGTTYVVVMTTADADVPTGVGVAMLVSGAVVLAYALSRFRAAPAAEGPLLDSIP